MTAALYTDKDKYREAEERPRKGDAEPYRDAWRVDYARLVHSPAFRRLQGKTQLFPGESDFFRNRLTHSIEVSQIAKSIAIRLNHNHFSKPQTPDDAISTDLVEFAALAHDLGHPPFGHQGEAALDECMRPFGGFEGNAQTLRLLSRIEKKRTVGWPPSEFEGGRDLRRGLNCTLRSLASILKYDHVIARRPESGRLEKGYYDSEAELVSGIRAAVLDGRKYSGEFKTIECQIMDIADDIAYSTYDFEDAMKAGFTSPLDLLRLPTNPRLLRRIAVKIWLRMNNRSDPIDSENLPEEIKRPIEETEDKVTEILVGLNDGLVPSQGPIEKGAIEDSIEDSDSRLRQLLLVGNVYNAAKNLQENGYLRTSFTSELVGLFIGGISLEVNPNIPAMSQVVVDPSVREKIEVLKTYTYETHIDAARLRGVEFRGKEIVSSIFDCIRDHPALMPADWRVRYEAISDNDHRLRCVCDFVAGMTDKYALDFYHRLFGGDPGTIFRDP